jgi:hypothetical protein
MEGEAEMEGRADLEVTAEGAAEAEMVLVVPAYHFRFLNREVLVVGEVMEATVVLAGMPETAIMEAEEEQSALHIRPVTIPTESPRTCQESLPARAAQEVLPDKADCLVVVEMEAVRVAYCAAVEVRAEPEAVVILEPLECPAEIREITVLPAIQGALP